MKRNKGITLIALVITIIVLLILAGVAISMLSGENGILRKAAEAKTKTEEAQKEEDTSLIDMELTTHFMTNNSKYKCSYGYITGFTIVTAYIDNVEQVKVQDKVSDLQKELPNGYSVRAEDGSTDFIVANGENDPIISTGLEIVNSEGKEVARTIVFFDTDCNGIITLEDATTIAKIAHEKCELKPYQKVAGNVYEDDELNVLDQVTVQEYLALNTARQNIKIVPADRLKRNDKKIKEFISKMPEKSPYTFEYNEEEDTYKLKGVTPETTFGTLKQNLPEGYEYTLIKGGKKLDNDESEVMNSNKLWIKIEYKQTYTEDGETWEEQYYANIKMNIEVK